MIGTPPLSAGGVQVTAIDVAVTSEPATLVGAPGVVAARAGAGGVDHGPLPMAFTARTWKT
jgi:hypothetical protein